MLEIIQIITIVITSIAVGMTWGMLFILKRYNNIQKFTPIAMIIGTTVWISGIVMMAIGMLK